MTKELRTARLRGLMAAHGLSAAEVGEIVERSPQTVRAWACKYPERAIPSHTLQVLELKLVHGHREAAQAAA